MDQEELLAILRKSQGQQPGAAASPACCAISEGIFLQVLEGGRSAVNRLYNRIAADPRHAEVELLSYEEIGERRFAGWSMGQVNMSAAEPGAAAEVLGDGDAGPVRGVGRGVDGAVRGTRGHRCDRRPGLAGPAPRCGAAGRRLRATAAPPRRSGRAAAAAASGTAPAAPS
ncbi:MAG: BLUF domain-containing protein [Comamonadaceae bacterium]|nr:BLUF domain-containing protein [Comamonadaceae bacterium]